MAVGALTEHGVQFLNLMVEVPIFQILESIYSGSFASEVSKYQNWTVYQAEKFRLRGHTQTT